MKKVIKTLRRIFQPPQVETVFPGVDLSDFREPSVQKTIDDHELVKIARANFDLQREATQHNLNLVYGSMLVSLLASIIATAALIVAIVKK